MIEPENKSTIAVLVSSIVAATPIPAVLVNQGSIIHANDEARAASNLAREGVDVRVWRRSLSGWSFAEVETPVGSIHYALDRGHERSEGGRYAHAMLMARANVPVPDSTVSEGDKIVDLNGTVHVATPLAPADAARALRAVARARDMSRKMGPKLHRERHAAGS